MDTLYLHHLLLLLKNNAQQYVLVKFYAALDFFILLDNYKYLQAKTSFFH